MLSGKFSSTYTFKDNVVNLIELSNILNSIPGAHKDWKSWRKTWQDMRSRTKQKLSGTKLYEGGTGGGPFVDNNLTKLEEDIMQIIKLVSVEGHTVPVSNVEFDFEKKKNEAAKCENLILTEDNNEDKASESLSDQLFPNPNTSTPKSNTKPKSGIKRIIPKRNSLKMVLTKTAVASYELTLNKKIDIKKEYYDKKLDLLEQQTKAKEVSAQAFVKISDILEKMANCLEEIVPID